MTWLLILNIIVTVLFFLGSIYIANKINKLKFQGLEDKIIIIWNYLIKRAETEFITKGLGTINSPYYVTDEVKKWYEPISAELHRFYNKIGVNLTNTELFIMVHKEFGNWIIENICIPHNLESGACIIAAVAVAKEAA